MVRRGASQFGVWVALLLLIPYLEFVGGAWFGLYLAPLRVASLALIAGVLGAWITAMWRDASWRPRSALLPVIVLALGSLALSTALSRHPRISLEYLAYAVILASLYLLLVRLLRMPFLAHRIPNLAVVFALVVAVFFLVAVGSRWAQWWGLVGHVTFPPLRPASESFVYGNPSSVLAVVVLFVASSLAVIKGPGIARVGLALALLAMMATVALVSGSRAGWLAIGATALVLVVGAVVDTGARAGIGAAIARVRTSRAATTVLLGLAAVAFVVGIALAPGVIRRALEGGDEIRAGFVIVALHMFYQSPIVGTGPGTWVADRVRFTQPDLVDYYIPHAHNVYAQTLAELGLVGAIIGVLVVIAIARLIWGGLGSADATRRGWGWAALAATTYFAAHSTLDFFMNMPAILFPLALPIAVLDATAAAPTISKRTGSLTRGRSGAIAFGVVVVAAISGLVRLEIAAIASQRAVDAANLGRWDAALEPAHEAVASDPDMPPYHFTLGLALSRAGDHAGAEREFRAVAEGTDLPEAWLNLASELAALGRNEEAVGALERALRLGVQRPAVAMPAGELALRLGSEGHAAQAFGAALIRSWTLAADPWWTTSRARGQAFASAFRYAIDQIAPANAWELALMAGDSDLASALAGASSNRALADLAIRAWDRDAQATADLFAGCAARPLELGWLTWCGRIAGRDGDVRAAAKYRLTAGLTLGGEEESASLLRVAGTQESGRWMSGGPAEFWGYYTYRRPTPWDLLVPDLVHLVTR
ncbi:MAG: O-antigen ligase family protein [Chloroflexota bacterium]